MISNGPEKLSIYVCGLLATQYSFIYFHEDKNSCIMAMLLGSNLILITKGKCFRDHCKSE